MRASYVLLLTQYLEHPLHWAEKHRARTPFTVFSKSYCPYSKRAKALLDSDDALYPAFATHNAYTVGAVKALAGSKPFEFQRLHGMGEDVYVALA